MKKFLSLLLAAVLVLGICGCGKTNEPEKLPDILNGEYDAVYLGVENWGTLTRENVTSDGAEVQKFQIGEETVLLSVKNDPEFSIQNKLMENYKYHINVENDVVISAEYSDETTEFKPVVSSEPGLKTLKNFLATAFAPMGTTLYVYGGAWNWQDDGSSLQSTSIGVSGSWVDFYNSNDAEYMYCNDADPASSTFPYDGWNQYYYAGADCSGFAGWTVYNTLNTESGHEGYVTGASIQAYLFDKEYRFGDWTSKPFDTEEDPLRPGDIISTPSHIWICVGKCEDGSIVAIHSTVTASSAARMGGGVQLSAINPMGSSKDCMAYELAKKYTEKYYPDWIARYPVVMKSYYEYVDFKRENAYVGRFRWDTNGYKQLTDPDGYAEMSAAEVLADLFGE